jgi:hypothetical protein
MISLGAYLFHIVKLNLIRSSPIRYTNPVEDVLNEHSLSLQNDVNKPANKPI